MKEWNRTEIAELLEQSGRIAMEYKTKMSPEIKQDHTIVTQADKAVQSFLDTALTAGETDVYIIGEESLENCDLDKALANITFVIDPIDGTAIYASGLPMWGISIGYAVKGKLQESAIYLPETEELMITESGKTYLRTGNQNEFQELKPFRKEYTDTGAVYITQQLARKGTFAGGELIQSIGSCVYPGIYLARQIYQAGVFRAKLWDLAGFLPALKNLGFHSVSKHGTNILSLEISSELYNMDVSSVTAFRMNCHHILASTEENCRRVLEKCVFPEDQ